MLIAGTLELDKILSSLAARRPVFHSEADFQVALAWEVQTNAPSMYVYLETRPIPGVHLDLAFESEDRAHYTALELKYLTRKWDGVVDGQEFHLAKQGAHNQTRFAVVNDIHRVEHFVKARPGANGGVVLLTNDPSYWTPNPASTANDLAFRFDEGAVLEGDRVWTRRPAVPKYDQDLRLDNRYEMHWADFSKFEGKGILRQLVVEVPEYHVVTPTEEAGTAPR